MKRWSVVVVAAVAAAPAHAGVWIRDPGAAWFQGSFGASTSARTFDAHGALLPSTDPAYLGSVAPLFESGRYTGFEAGLYAELGVVRGFEVVASLPVRQASMRWRWATGYSEPIVQTNRGFGDTTLGARGGGQVGGVALSLYAGARLPLYDNAPEKLGMEAGNSDFYDNVVPLGQGTIEGEVLAGAGTGLGVLEGWALIEAGGRVRDRGFSAAIPGRLQVGLQPGGVALWLSADGVASLGNGAAPDYFVDRWGKGPLIPDNQSWLAAGAGVLVPLGEDWSVLATGGHVVAARRYPSLAQATIGVAWHGSLWEVR